MTTTPHQVRGRGQPDKTRVDQVRVPEHGLADDILQGGAEYRQQEDGPAAVPVGEDAERDGDDEARHAVEGVEHLGDGRELGLDGGRGAVVLACGGGVGIVAAADDALQNLCLGRLQEEAGQVHQDHHDECCGDNTALVGRVSINVPNGTQQRPLFTVGARHLW